MAGLVPAIHKEFQEETLGFPWISLSESSLFKDMWRPLGRYFFFPAHGRLAAFGWTRGNPAINPSRAGSSQARGLAPKRLRPAEGAVFSIIRTSHSKPRLPRLG
jgi:hypothetical protein